MTVTLRIKKKYFDAILSGEKKIEYRDDKPYYNRIFSNRVDRLFLHYQHGRWLDVRVRRVRKIKTPAFIKNLGIPFGEKVYAIEVFSPREFFR